MKGRQTSRERRGEGRGEAHGAEERRGCKRRPKLSKELPLLGRTSRRALDLGFVRKLLRALARLHNLDPRPLKGKL